MTFTERCPSYVLQFQKRKMLPTYILHNMKYINANDGKNFINRFTGHRIPLQLLTQC